MNPQASAPLRRQPASQLPSLPVGASASPPVRQQGASYERPESAPPATAQAGGGGEPGTEACTYAPSVATGLSHAQGVGFNARDGVASPAQPHNGCLPDGNHRWRNRALCGSRARGTVSLRVAFLIGIGENPSCRLHCLREQRAHTSPSGPPTKAATWPQAIARKPVPTKSQSVTIMRGERVLPLQPQTGQPLPPLAAGPVSQGKAPSPSSHRHATAQATQQSNGPTG